ncbi:hypothetical protein K470DRAFT_292497 [Piedraia hortae CBS 480.64]|uniref:Uncharacterized protein n=1 Tax=Piedraia hortae CBS 480.64 TaxID=1314780 RepID=A0A6A7C848_9PEZI|nr:hypothetical protein K470DRAFT_292497 [Piedraia hortae CBS 480.64]
MDSSDQSLHRRTDGLTLDDESDESYNDDSSEITACDVGVEDQGLSAEDLNETPDTGEDEIEETEEQEADYSPLDSRDASEGPVPSSHDKDDENRETSNNLDAGDDQDDNSTPSEDDSIYAREVDEDHNSDPQSSEDDVKANQLNARALEAESSENVNDDATVNEDNHGEASFDEAEPEEESNEQ